MQVASRRLVVGLAVVAAVAVLGAALTWMALRSSDDVPREVVDPATAAKTSFPDLESASGEPSLPGIRSAGPAVGAVETLSGPFDDRFRWQDLRLRGATVSGSIRVTSDVSDLLELQVLAGFYDRDGTLLATRRFVHHLVEEGHAGVPNEVESFEIAAPARVRAEVAAAAVGVPVLVNE